MKNILEDELFNTFFDLIPLYVFIAFIWVKPKFYCLSSI